MKPSLEFVAQGQAGRVDVSLAPIANPVAVGCDPGAEGFPMCHAVVIHDAQDYDTLLGWVQLVGTGVPRAFDIDPLRIYEGFETPFGFFGLAPTLFDGPYRLDRNQDLDWAHNFFCVSPSRPMKRDVLAVVGFSGDSSSRTATSRWSNRNR